MKTVVVDEATLAFITALGEQAAVNLIVKWMSLKDYATGHGETAADLLGELERQAKERGQNMSKNHWDTHTYTPPNNAVVTDQVLAYWNEHGHTPPNPNIVNLDKFKGVSYTSEIDGAKCGAIYDIRMVKWLIKNRGKDYFESDAFKEVCRGDANVSNV